MCFVRQPQNPFFVITGIARQLIEEIIETLGEAPDELISTEPRHVVFTRLVKNSLAEVHSPTTQLWLRQLPQDDQLKLRIQYLSNYVCLSISLVAFFSVAAIAFFDALVAAHAITVFLYMGVIPPVPVCWCFLGCSETLHRTD